MSSRLVWVPNALSPIVHLWCDASCFKYQCIVQWISEGGHLACATHTKFLVMKTLESTMYMVHSKLIMSESRACELLLPVSLIFFYIFNRW